MLPGFFSKPRMTLAIDFGPDAVRVLEVSRRNGGAVVSFSAEQAVEVGPAASLPERHLTALTSLLSENRLRTRHAIAALPTTIVLTRTVTLDQGKKQSAEEQIEKALQNCLPFDNRDLTFDYWTVSENGKSREVMVVATQASVVNKYLAGLAQLHIKCIHMDIAPCAIGTLLASSTERKDAPIGTVMLTRNQGYFAVAQGKQILFWRPFDLSSGPRTEITDRATLNRIGDEISKCVAHVVGTMQVDNLTEMVMFGEGAGDAAVDEYLTARFHLPVRAPSPFDAFAVDARAEALRGTGDLKQTTHFCTAVGLALQQATGGIAYG